jgi:hypothetical protein
MHKSFALVASLATLPSLAQAQGNSAPSLGCPLIRAMTNVDGGDFRSIRLSMRPPFLAVGRAETATVQPAADCSAELSADETYIGCHWDGPEGVDPTMFDTVVSELSQCLRVSLPTATGPELDDRMRVLKRSMIDIDVPGGTTGITVRLLEAPGQQVGGAVAGRRQWVVLDINYTVTHPSGLD